MQLSHSSAALLRTCEQRFYFYKTNEPKDSDYEEDASYLTLGSSFHYILEQTKHTKPDKISILLDHCVKELKLREQDVALVHAMVLKYLRLHKKTELECVACEVEIETDSFIGYVDAVMADSTGWWIVDLKTSSRFSPSILPRLKLDPQLNLYAYHADLLANKLNLDVKNFLGCRYRVTTKSIAKQRKDESYVDFVTRLIDLVSSYDIVVPVEKMKPKQVYQDHTFFRNHGIKILSHGQGNKNLEACNNFFKPCPYFSKCHGEEFSKNDCGLEIFEI